MRITLPRIAPDVHSHRDPAPTLPDPTERDAPPWPDDDGLYAPDPDDDAALRELVEAWELPGGEPEPEPLTSVDWLVEESDALAEHRDRDPSGATCHAIDLCSDLLDEMRRAGHTIASDYLDDPRSPRRRGTIERAEVWADRRLSAYADRLDEFAAWYRSEGTDVAAMLAYDLCAAAAEAESYGARDAAGFDAARAQAVRERAETLRGPDRRAVRNDHPW